MLSGLETRSLGQHNRHNVVSSLVKVCTNQSYNHGFLGIHVTSTKQGVNVTCSRLQRTATRPGLEPGTPWSVVRDPHHCAIPPLVHYMNTSALTKIFTRPDIESVCRKIPSALHKTIVLLVSIRIASVRLIKHT